MHKSRNQKIWGGGIAHPKWRRRQTGRNFFFRSRSGGDFFYSQLRKHNI